MEIGVASNNQKVLLKSRENKTELQVMKVVVGVEGRLLGGGLFILAPEDAHGLPLG